jgi:hypothetical protein
LDGVPFLLPKARCRGILAKTIAAGKGKEALKRKKTTKKASPVILDEGKEEKIN